MRKHFVVGVIAAITLVAACGSDDEPAATDPPATAATSASPATDSASTAVSPASTSPASAAPTSAPDTDATDAPATTAVDGPQAIISLAPTHTETLFAIGAGDQVIAVDDQSDFPADAAAVSTDLSGFEPNVEAIAGYEPDLVVLSDATIQPQLESLGDVPGGRPELVGQMRTDIDSIVASVPPPAEPLTIYHELDNTYYSVNSSTFIGQAYTVLGLRNIADTAEGDSGGYPQLNAEAIISADPDLIFLADASFGESLETVSARPGWQDITAVANGAIVALDEDVASRWGPRIVDYVQSVADAVTQVSVPG